MEERGEEGGEKKEEERKEGRGGEEEKEKGGKERKGDDRSTKVRTISQHTFVKIGQRVIIHPLSY